MHLNPMLCRDVLTGEIFPAALAGEIFALRRDDIRFDGEFPGFKKLKARGRFFLTSHRIIFLAETEKSQADFSSVALLFSDMRCVPDFRQPIFGANYLEISSVDGSKCSLSFMSGGCQAFLSCFFRIFDQRPTAAIAVQVLQQRASNVAYVDPNDPSVFYVSQPRAE